MTRILPILLLLTTLLRADQSVTLAWDPNPEPDVSSYAVYYGTNSRAYPQSTNVGNVTTATVYGLPEGRTYYFAITAKNNAGLESDFSNEVTNAIPATATNSAPTITPIADQVIVEGGFTNLAVNIWDVETHPTNLVMSATSTNTALLPQSGITWGTTPGGYLRLLSLVPAAGQSGRTLVTVAVSDGTKAASTAFLLTVINRPEPCAHMRFVLVMQVATNQAGPWQNVQTTIVPPVMLTNLFYREWR